ncbi:MAG: AAA domain-containing protein [Pyrinomonadaceae bacterium]
MKIAKNNDVVDQALANDEAQIVAGTVWLWARPEVANAIDVLFVDEAGQMSLANVLAASRSADSIVLLGDPQQLISRSAEYTTKCGSIGADASIKRAKND